MRSPQPRTCCLPPSRRASNCPPTFPWRSTSAPTSSTSAYTTEYDKAAAIQAFLRGPLFHYDLNGAPTGPGALSEFLFVSHTGYCEQFAGAMAVLARAAGIPARVAVGFTPGTLQPDGSWLITNHDAHSWPELWFPQAGWVRFEPTPRDASTDPPAYTLAPAGSQVTTTPTPTPTAGQSSAAAPSASASSSAASAAGPVSGSSGGHGTGSAAALGWGIGLAAAALLLLTPAALRRNRRRRRLSGSTLQPGALWAEILDTAVDLGLSPSPNLSPRRLVQFWSRGPNGERAMPDITRSVILDIAHAQELDRYAGGARVPGDAAVRLPQALRAWEHSQVAAVRWRAWLAPPSVLAGLARWWAGLPWLRGVSAARSSSRAVSTSLASPASVAAEEQPDSPVTAGRCVRDRPG